MARVIFGQTGTIGIVGAFLLYKLLHAADDVLLLLLAFFAVLNGSMSRFLLSVSLLFSAFGIILAFYAGLKKT